jgi:hypothetical protein
MDGEVDGDAGWGIAAEDGGAMAMDEGRRRKGTDEEDDDDDDNDDDDEDDDEDDEEDKGGATDACMTRRSMAGLGGGKGGGGGGGGAAGGCERGETEPRGAGRCEKNGEKAPDAQDKLVANVGSGRGCGRSCCVTVVSTAAPVVAIRGSTITSSQVERRPRR